MKFIKLLFYLVTVVSFQSLANTEDEINYLLEFVQSTDCQYERNDKLYNGEEAVQHIKKKYKYFIDDIKTTEDFITYSATKSKMSGKYYTIHCLDNPSIKSKDWLLAALKRYRTEKTK